MRARPYTYTAGAILLATTFWLVRPALGDGPDGTTWESIVQEGRRSGLPARQIEAIADRCRRRNMQPGALQEMLAPALKGARAGLPTLHIVAKIEEGVVKNAPVAATAARTRLRHTEQSRLLLAPHFEPDKRGVDSLTVATALAIESGVPDSALRNALGHSAGKSPGQMKTVIEAGETLFLAGLEAESIGSLLVDYLQRDLRRSEILRATRYARHRHRERGGSPAARRELWGKGAGEGYGHALRTREDGAAERNRGRGPAADVGGPGPAAGPGSPGGHDSDGPDAPGDSGSGSDNGAEESSGDGPGPGPGGHGPRHSAEPAGDGP